VTVAEAAARRSTAVSIKYAKCGKNTLRTPENSSLQPGRHYRVVLVIVGVVFLYFTMAVQEVSLPARGRALIATADIPAGHAIMVEQPLAAAQVGGGGVRGSGAEFCCSEQSTILIAHPSTRPP
jgi:hypothetical protein